MANEPSQAAGPSKVFISYSAADDRFAKLLHENLRSIDIDAFLDSELPAGSSFQEVLGEAIIRSDLVIVVMSPAYFRSQWCQAELALALRAGKRLLPILLDGEPQGLLSHLGYFDASEESLEELPALIADVARGSHGR